MCLDQLTEYLSHIPDVVWSGLIASALTLSGVLISNASNTRRLKIQLSHDSGEKAKERTGKLRQEVYLLVAEELAKANSVLGSLTQGDLTSLQATTEMTGLFSAVEKLKLVAEPDTALLVGELSASYGAALMRLLAASTPLMDIRIDIDIAGKSYEEASKEASRYLSIITDMIDSGQIDAAGHQKLQNRFEFHQQRAEQHAEERTAMWAKQSERQLNFTKNLVSELKALSGRYVAAITAIRSDLGLPAESQKFAEQMAGHWENMENELYKTLNTLKPNGED